MYSINLTDVSKTAKVQKGCVEHTPSYIFELCSAPFRQLALIGNVLSMVCRLALCALCWPDYTHVSLASCHSEHTCTPLIMEVIVKLTTKRHRFRFAMCAGEAMCWIVYHTCITGHMRWLHLKLNTSSEVGGWLRPGTRFVSFFRARARSGCQVEFELNWGDGVFLLFPLGPPSFPFSLVWQSVCPFPHVKSKWDRRIIEVNSKWNQSGIDVNPKWNRSEVELKSKWNRNEIEVNSKWNWSEFEVSSKWIRSEIELNPPPPTPHPTTPNSYPTLVGLIGRTRHTPTANVCFISGYPTHVKLHMFV
jgi:hypothetical protein